MSNSLVMLSAMSLPILAQAMPSGRTTAPPPSTSAPATPLTSKSVQSLAAQIKASMPGNAASRRSGPRSLKNFAATPAKSLNITKGDVIVSSDVYRGVTGVTPNAARGKRTLGRLVGGQTPEGAARDFVHSRKDIFAISDADADLVLGRTEIDSSGGAHLFFDQQLNGIPFWGRQLAAHFNKGGDLEAINCLLSTDAKSVRGAKTSIVTSAAQAILTAQQQMSYDGVAIDTPTGLNASLLKYSGPVATMYYWQRDPGDDTHLVWLVEDRPNFKDWYRFFIDATTGEILEYYNNTQADGPTTANAINLLNQSKTVRGYQIGSTYYMIDTTRPMYNSGASTLPNDPKGAIVTLDLRNAPASSSSQIFFVTSTNNSWTDKTSVSAHDYGAVAYEYYRTAQNRNSLDGKGGSIISIIHVDQSLDNAYWNGQFMLYGDGGTQFQALARGLDVAAHEMTHGVTQNTANLEYKNQSGALNESMSDVFGIMVDADDYKLGEDVVKLATYPSGTLRDLQNPHNGGSSLNDNGWQPAQMSEFVQLSLSQDNGGVHVNSGIPNHAAYYLTNAIGRTKAGALYYKALTTKLLKQSNFADCRKALEDVAIADFGNNSTEHNAVKTAFANVGIGSAGTTEPPPDDPIPPGTDKYYTIGNDNFLYYTPDLQNFTLLLNQQVNAFQGGVNDPGSAKPYTLDPLTGDAYFVGSSHGLYYAPVSGSGGGYITGTSGFASISFSPSGRKLALTAFNTVKDNHVYILDLGVDPAVLTQYTLYHPTTAEGVYDDTIYRVDSLDWIDDQLLIFDCLNVSGTGNGARAFWDINILDTNSTPATPIIYPLLPGQQEGINIGNPVVSTLNGSIICFDYFDNNQNPGSFVWSANLYTGDLNSNFIDVGSNDIAICDYSPDDSKIYVSLGDPSSSYNGYRASLSSDRMSVTSAFTNVVSMGGYVNHFASNTSTSNRPTLVNYLLGYPVSPAIVDFNGDGRSDASDIKNAPTN
ncbi:MAG: M4 family metallopeptidase [Candidatus Sumerlaeota bacterium]